MKSRFLAGAASLAVVGLTIGGGAAAQRLQRLRQTIQAEQQLRSKIPADPNPTPIRAPGDYRFSFIHDGITREYLVHVPTSYR